jgi:hypothetical protein
MLPLTTPLRWPDPDHDDLFDPDADGFGDWTMVERWAGPGPFSPLYSWPKMAGDVVADLVRAAELRRLMGQEP